MKDDSREKRRRELLPRISLLACLGLVVVSLGAALSPQTPEEPAEPPFSEQARSAALAETMRLRAAGEQLSQSPSADGQPAVGRTVSLLTSQARALLVPGQKEAGASPPTGAAAVSTAPAAAASASAAAASGSASPAVPASAAALATELAASASQRLADAALADGGMARLLAAVGTAQLLQASALAAAAGAPAPAVPDPTAPQPSGVCPSASASPSPSPAGGNPAAGSLPSSAGRAPAAASLPAALAETVETELETVYGYQVALTRLGGEAAAPASEQLARHEYLATGAEALSRMNCAPIPPREAGYTMAPGFLASPSAGLGGLEASALPVYGDLVALSDGETRQWAISGLVGAARRSALWGGDAGALPGLTADPDSFPELP